MNFISKKENISGNRIRIKFEIPVQELQIVYQKRLQSLVGKTQLLGFRKGKVPAKIVEERSGDQLNYETINEVVSLAVDEFLKQQDFSIYGSPFVEDKDIEKKCDLKNLLKVNVICYLPPSCRIKNYDSLVLTEDTVQIDDVDFEQAFQRLLRPHGKLVEVSDQIKTFDIVEMDLIFEDKKYTALNLDHHVFYFDEHSDDVFPPFLSDLRSSILSKKSGDKWSEKVVFSKKLSGEYALLVGAKTVCACVINKVKRMELPSLDEEFLKKLGVKNEEELCSQIRKNLQEHAEATLKQHFVDLLIEQMKKNSEFDIPSLAVDYVVGHYWENHLERYVAKDQQKNASPDEKWLEQAKKKGMQEIEVQLLFEQMIDEVKTISPDEKEVTKEIERLLQTAKEEEREHWQKKLADEEGEKKD